MSPNQNNDDTPDDARDDRSTQPESLLDQLYSLLASLDEIDEEEGSHPSGSGHIERGSARIDYDYNVSVGLGQNDHPSGPDTAASPHQSHSDQRPTESSIPIEIREGRSDDELVVIADLPGVTDDDDVEIDLNTDDSALILRIDENEIKWIPLDRSDMTITDMTINNQILELRVSQASDSSGGETE